MVLAIKWKRVCFFLLYDIGCCFEKENYEIYSELLENTNIWLEIEEELIKIGGNQVFELGEA